MHANTIALTLAATAGPLLARADLKLERDDIPSACASICGPIRSLSQTCDVDINGMEDRAEDLLQLQCLCTNNSFSVGQVAGLCQSCMAQNTNSSDKDNLEDINQIVRKCGFARQSYASSLSTAAATVTVQATRPTASSDLTTTFSAGSAQTNSPGTGTTTTSGGTAQTSAPGSAASPSLLKDGALYYVAGAVVFGSMMLL